jgi:hypothetical protein
MPPKPIPLRRPFRLSAVKCERHAGRRVTVVAFPADDAQPLRCFCCVDCARLAGWPFLPSTKGGREDESDARQVRR